MAFKIYVSDQINSAELDTEELDVKSIYALLDITDIGNKRANIQTLNLKGTKNNNNVFGYFFNIERLSSVSFPNKIFFNYNPLRPVDIFIFEDSDLIFNGDLRINEIKIDGDNNIIYECLINTVLLKVKQAFQNKFLTDLDMSKWRHRYCLSVIENNFGTIIEYTENGSLVASTTPFDERRGYVYPLIDYGFPIPAASTGFSQNGLIHSINNFRPALWLNEIMNSIFEQSLDLTNGERSLSWELRASDQFKDDFLNCIIPDCNDDQYDKITGITSEIGKNNLNDGFTWLDYLPGTPTLGEICASFLAINSNPPWTFWSYILAGGGPFSTKRLISYDFLNNPSGFAPYLQITDSGTKVLFLNSVRTNLKVNFTFSITQINTAIIPTQPTLYKFLLVKFTDPVNNPDVYTILDSTETFTLANGGTITGQAIELSVGYLDYNKGDKIGLYLETTNYLINITIRCDLVPPTAAPPVNTFVNTYNVSNLRMYLPASSGDTLFFKAEPRLDCNASQLIVPKCPANVKIVDFLKSVMQLFNLVAYYENNDFNKIIFTPYNEFYELTRLPNVLSNSLDWTNKVDYTNNYTIKSNIDLPKKYTFTFKTDDDRLNKIYTEKYKENYGQFSFDDDLGTTDEKKVELIFAPSIWETQFNYFIPCYYKVDSNNNKQTMKLVPRIVYYNGYDRWENQQNFGQIVYEGPDYISSTPPNPIIPFYSILTAYPNCGNYRLIPTGITSGYTVFNVDNDLHFGQPYELYFIEFAERFNNLPNSYTKRYIDQITDLTDFDVIYLECDVLLNPLDISNLDLSVPIYIQTGDKGGSYFRVLEVEYENKNTPSRVKLQKIIV